MKFVDIENWNRKNHFNYFKQLDYPHFNVCANVDITNFYRFIKQNGLPFYISMIYAATSAANSIKEFRYRIRGENVVEHEIINPSFTVMTDDEIFSFCGVKYSNKFEEFRAIALKGIEMVRNNAVIEDEPDRDDLLFITCVPWISFTNITHPIHMHPVDCIPRISWGKYIEENGKMKMPLSVQAHHAIVDGVHAGKYYNKIQEILDNPERYF